MPTKETTIAVLGSRMESIAIDVKDIKQKLEDSYATKEWVDAKLVPLYNTKKQVDAVIWIIVSAVVVALLALIIKK